MPTERTPLGMEKVAAEMLSKSKAPETAVAEPPKPESTPEPKVDNTAAPESNNDADYQKALDEYSNEAFKSATQPQEEEIDLKSLDPKVAAYIEKIKSKQPEVKEVVPQDIQEKLSKAEKIFGNDLVSKLAEYLTTDGDLEEKLATLFTKQGKDYSELSNDDVITEYFKSIYDKPEEVSKAIQDFKEVNSKDYQIRQEVKRIREELSKRNPAKLSDKYNELIGSKLSNYQKATKEQKAEQEKVNNLYQTAVQSADKNIKELKDFNGITISDADRKEILDLTTYSMPIIKGKDGKVSDIDFKKGLDMALRLKYFDAAVKNAQLKGYQDGLKKFYRPSANNSSNANAASNKTGSSPATEAAEKRLKSAFVPLTKE